MMEKCPRTQRKELKHRMQLSELAAELGLSENYLRNQWALLVKRYESYGIELVKRGRGRVADFGIKNYADYEVRWEPVEGRTIC